MTHPDIIGPVEARPPRDGTRRGSGNLTPLERASRMLRILYECKRCNRKTYKPLNAQEECSICAVTPEAITPENIAAEAAAIRAGWKKRDWKNQPGAPKPWRPPGSKFNETKR